MNNIPFTYYLYWSELDLHYYGVRYAIDCNPNELWTTYFTSSTYVKRLRKNYGDPDIIQVRKTFSDATRARQWETVVLRRIKALDKMNWLNCANQSTRVRKNFDGFLAPNFGYVFTPIEKVNKSVRYKKHKWWNNGTNQYFCETPPDDSYSRGRLQFNNVGAQIGANISKTKKWYTNGTDSVFTVPGTEPDGYYLGRKIPGRKQSNPLKGAIWWTNDITSKLSFTCPGPEWKRGRRYSS